MYQDGEVLNGMTSKLLSAMNVGQLMSIILTFVLE
jgi:hypothetical protein